MSSWIFDKSRLDVGVDCKLSFIFLIDASSCCRAFRALSMRVSLATTFLKDSEPSDSIMVLHVFHPFPTKACDRDVIKRESCWGCPSAARPRAAVVIASTSSVRSLLYDDILAVFSIWWCLLTSRAPSESRLFLSVAQYTAGCLYALNNRCPWCSPATIIKATQIDLHLNSSFSDMSM